MSNNIKTDDKATDDLRDKAPDGISVDDIQRGLDTILDVARVNQQELEGAADVERQLEMALQITSADQLLDATQQNLVAYLIANSAPMDQISRATGLSAVLLAKVADTPEIKEKVQEHEMQFAEVACTTDELLGNIEQKSLSQLQEMLDLMPPDNSDQLLRIAAFANKAHRRSPRQQAIMGGGRPNGYGGGAAHVDATGRKPRLEGTKTVILRTRFAKHLQDGSSTMMDRQTIIIADGDQRENRMDDMTPAEVRELVEGATGVKLDEVRGPESFGILELE